MTYASRSPYLSISTDPGTRRPSPRRVPGLPYAPRRVPGLPYAPRRVPGLPYAPGQRAVDGLGDIGGSAPLIIGGVLVAGLVAVGIYFAVKKSKDEASVRAALVEKEGAAGLARYEEAQLKRSAGEAGINLLSSWLKPPMRRNRKAKRKSSRSHDEE